MPQPPRHQPLSSSHAAMVPLPRVPGPLMQAQWGQAEWTECGTSGTWMHSSTVLAVSSHPLPTGHHPTRAGAEKEPFRGNGWCGV